MSSDKTNEPVEGDNEDTDVAVVDDDSTAAELDTPSTEEAAENDEATTDAEAPASGARRGRFSWAGRHWAAIVLAVLLVASAGAAGAVYWWMYRPDQQTNAAVQQQAISAARDGTVALLSYAPDSLDKDLANAKSHLTGEFLKYYSQFTDQIVAPAAKQKGVKTEATVARAALSELHPDNATVLVFVNQVTTSKDRPDPALATSSVMVKLTKTDGHWLISEFNPI
ncbi:twin-arginine translocation pathway signal [Mycolicibacterium sp. P1-5]|uniref:twin-arginine translocation pathway signal n=1 Tax=Mycolicibacterium sp. P1-5 TaxID=2024617 RepID=UPI0011EBE74D|nr:twin-arginine translocation pathway signal [Mycolicibacterium sp. P1-5]KAA0107532.1 twin-arginine translocation pathway signal [Mycolicibacterium sp. P1-5]